MRATWQKPKLIVLGKGAPEEYVLGCCKDVRIPTGPSGPMIDQIDCIQNLVNCEICFDPFCS